MLQTTILSRFLEWNEIYRWLKVQDCSISITNALEILLSCSKPSTYETYIAPNMTSTSWRMRLEPMFICPYAWLLYISQWGAGTGTNAKELLSQMNQNKNNLTFEIGARAVLHVIEHEQSCAKTWGSSTWPDDVCNSPFSWKGRWST